MKKTIAKLMAAAMLLSAVPAVSMPSFVSKAAGSTAPQVTSTAATSTAESQFKEAGQLGAAPKGEIFSFVLPQGATKEQFSAASTGGNGLVSPYVNLSIVTDGANNSLMHVVCSVNYSKMTSAQKTDFVKSIRDGSNTFRVKLTRKRVYNDATGGRFTAGGVVYGFNAGPVNLDTTDSDLNRPLVKLTNDDRFNIMFKAEQEFTWTSPKEYRIGGIVEDGKIKSGVMDADGYLADRNVYLNPNFKVVNDFLAEAEVLRQDKNEANKIKDNNNLRGQKLNMNTIWDGGVEYKVAKLGAQALKEAKMKKIELKNCNKVGKGALRKCKQLRNVNLKDKNKVRKIHTKAFYDCKNLRNITIDARKLNVVGKDAVGKVHKNCKIKLKASKSKYNDCVKKFKKSGAKNVKYSRLAP